MILNDRTVVPSHDVRGGILDPDSVLVEDRNRDSFGVSLIVIISVLGVLGPVIHY